MYYKKIQIEIGQAHLPSRGINLNLGQWDLPKMYVFH
jgi:hypothetical protein